LPRPVHPLDRVDTLLEDRLQQAVVDDHRLHQLGVATVVAHDGGDIRVIARQAGDADRLALQLAWSGDVRAPQGHHAVERALYDRCRGDYGHTLRAGEQHIRLVGDGDVTRAMGDEFEGIRGAGGYTCLHGQALPRVITLGHGD